LSLKELSFVACSYRLRLVRVLPTLLTKTHHIWRR